ncbi:MAG: M20/M25/M40 family metallo-hydrolase [Oscillospiraceae bacterium]|nr:M20/M25/M40 family metallo-hydrolase [Oscillospiraceae bacterium]
MNLLSKALLAVPCAAGALLLAAVVRTLATPSRVSDYKPSTDKERIALYSEKLARLIRCETLSSEEEPNIDCFLGFHKILEELYPRLHENLEKTVIDGNLLYRWRGKSDAKPVVLMAHQDVVPAEGEWTHAPFSGDIADGKVWGRGAADIKCSLMAFMQAVEELLETGYVPDNDVYLVSSCTEEWGGDGAPKIVDELSRRGVRPYMVCDEGGAIITDPISGVKGSFAMIGVFEKGQGRLRFTAKSTGGHASAPPKNGPIARLAAFETEVEKHDPFKRLISKEVRVMFDSLAPYGGFAMKLLLGNVWLFGPVMKLVMPSVSAQAAAMLRTTIAFTMQSGSDAFNVLPAEATVGANLRYIPHQGMDESNELITRLAAKYGLETEIVVAEDYSPPLNLEGDAYKLFTEVIEKTFPGLPYSPYVVTGGTDCRYFSDICDNCIRFAPVVFGPAQLKGMHGIDECIDADCLPGAVDFYRNIIEMNK